MTSFRLISEPAADLDVVAAFEWYDGEKAGLGSEFLGELHTTYARIQDGPLRYQDAAIRAGGSLGRQLLPTLPEHPGTWSNRSTVLAYPP